MRFIPRFTWAGVSLILLGIIPVGGAEKPLPPAGRSEFIVTARESTLSQYPEIRFRSGDDPAWSHPDFNDSDWERRTYATGLPARTGVYWVRFTLRQPEPPWPPRDGLSIAVVASYDLFMDGRLLARSGIVGADRDSEDPGPVDNIVRIPDSLLTPGYHVVAIRMSAWRSGFPIDFLKLNLAAGGYRQLIERRTEQATLAVVSVGAAFAFAAVFWVLWWFVDRSRALLLLGATGFVAAALQSLQAWRWLQEYRFDWHRPRLQVIALLVGAFGFLLVAALQSLFRMKRGWWRLGVLGVLMLLCWFFHGGWYYRISLQMYIVALVFAAGMAVWAVWQRRTGGLYILAGLVVSAGALLTVPEEFLERSFFLTFGAPILGCVVAVSLRMRDDRRAARQAQLTAARLEIELLKKQIQPHFIMNTLTSIMEVIEHDPRAALVLIEALGDEFRVLARVSSQQRVPLGQELDLCRTHLRVMSLRKDVRYALETRGPVDGIEVPPGILLTLVENGLTHDPARGEDVLFSVSIEDGPDVLRLVLVAPVGMDVTPSQSRSPEGTGLRYVQARLNESFPGRWTMHAGRVAVGWQTVIEISRRPVAAEVES